MDNTLKICDFGLTCYLIFLFSYLDSSFFGFFILFVSMSSYPKKTHLQKPKWSLIRSTAAAATTTTTTTTTTTSTISETSASADVITSHSPLPLTFPVVLFKCKLLLRRLLLLLLYHL